MSSVNDHKNHDTSNMGFATQAIHAGATPDQYGALVPPVYMTSTFAFETVEQGAAMFEGELAGHFYSRVSNPTVDILERRFAALEGAAAAVGFASGMGGIASTLWTLLSAGDEIIADETLYGCTFAFMEHGLTKFGVKIKYVDLQNVDAFEAAISADTKIVYFETPANPNMRLVDIAAICEIAKAKGLTSVVDNTYSTPYLTRPIELGADLVVHSATKYLGGHGDLIAGLVAGSAELMLRIRVEGLKDMTGAVMSPLTAHQIMRGMKTLELRMDRHCATAMMIAEELEAHPAVQQVFYPGLKSSPDHRLALKQMYPKGISSLGSGRYFGGMIAFELKGGIEAGRTMMNALSLVKRAVSLGDPDSLIQHPASMTHASYTPEERASHGITDGLIRLSVGLETPADILADLMKGLEAIPIMQGKAA
ncbi:MAG: methionine gamma-lyase [Robiginitomaculum sp.]|nr:methionine gamma-lyase [Robiginitomaculum sp.]